MHFDFILSFYPTFIYILYTFLYICLNIAFFLLGIQFSPIQKKGQHQLSMILNSAINQALTNHRSEYKISELQLAKLETMDIRGEYINRMSPFLILFVLLIVVLPTLDNNILI